MLDSTKPYCGLGNIQEFDRYAKRMFAEVITVPNRLLPTEFHDNKSKCRTLSRLDKLCDKRDGITEHTKLKALKARNIEKLAAQYEEKTNGGKIELASELDYSNNERDELRLHKNMMALVGGMINGGIIEEEDLDD